jgi:iron(III) transport system substrate-binding protein
MAELGYPGFKVLAWCGLAALAATPDALVARGNELANAALRDAKVREQISALDYDIRGGTAGEFAAFVSLDISRYKGSPRTWAWPRNERLTARSMTSPQRCIARATFVSLICLWTVAARAQYTSAATSAQSPSWIIPDLAAAARAEGALTVYSSMNEQEGLPLWKMFEDAAGVKVSYVRSSDSIILSRIAIESRGRQRSWDLAVTTTVNRLPNEALLQFDPPQARGLIAQARDPNRRWYGVYANYNTPAYNTNLVKPSQLPKSYEEFLDRREWAGKIALDDTDDEWLSAIIVYYGDERGKKLLTDIAAVLKPVMVDGHLALARSVGAGEYWLALNNYASLTLNVQLSGAAIDFWALDPVALFFGSVGVSSQAPHPKAALLGANFMLSREAEQFLTTRGRMPTRHDVPVNPPYVSERLKDRKIIATIFAGEEQRKWQGLFKDIFKPK